MEATYFDNSHCRGPTESPRFKFCTTCYRLSRPGARVCHRCGSIQVEELTLLDMAARLRDIIRGDMQNAPRGLPS